MADERYCRARLAKSEVDCSTLKRILSAIFPARVMKLSDLGRITSIAAPGPRVPVRLDERQQPWETHGEERDHLQRRKRICQDVPEIEERIDNPRQASEGRGQRLRARVVAPPDNTG